MYYQPENDFKPEEVLVYLRKSRSDDPTLGVAEVLARHETILDEWAIKHLGSVVPESNKYREVVSGETIDSRPEMLKLLKRVESPKTKAVLIVEVQRLGRPDLEDIGRLSKTFRYTNTLVITPPKTFDLRNEYDREAFERELMRGNEYLEYTKKIMERGRLLSVQQGNFVVAKSPYGYEKTVVAEGKTKCHTLKIVEDEANVVRMIYDLYVNKDLGTQKIANKLNKLGLTTRSGKRWGRDSIFQILRNEHYLGKIRWNWRKTINVVEDGEFKRIRPRQNVGEYLLFEGKHPAIISDELFAAAQEKNARTTPAVKPSLKLRNPFAGIIYCECGKSMTYKRYDFYGNYETNPKPPRLTCGDKYCKTASCLFSEMHERVCQILEESIEDFELRIENKHEDSVKLHENLIKHLKTKLENLNKKEISQWEKYSEEEMPKEIFETLNAKVLREKEEVQQALCTAYESMPEAVDYREKLKNFKAALEALRNPEIPVEEQNKLLKACIEKIIYRREPAERIRKEELSEELPLAIGANWTETPIELEVKLKQ